jgi:hypothetical protein
VPAGMSLPASCAGQAGGAAARRRRGSVAAQVARTHSYLLACVHAGKWISPSMPSGQGRNPQACLLGLACQPQQPAAAPPAAARRSVRVAVAAHAGVKPGQGPVALGGLGACGADLAGRHSTAGGVAGAPTGAAGLRVRWGAHRACPRGRLALAARLYRSAGVRHAAAIALLETCSKERRPPEIGSPPVVASSTSSRQACNPAQGDVGTAT